jgi:hypothetical protein
MNSLAYLLRKRLKNTFIEMLHKPGKLILWLALIGFIGFTFVVNALEPTAPEDIAPLYMLKGIVFLLFALFVVFGVRSGLSKGNSMFDMCDVNFLFTSPVDSRHILLYGVGQLMKMALYTSFFILYQASTFRMFGAGVRGQVFVMLGFVLCYMLTQILTLVIYSATNGKPGRQRVVIILTVAAFVPVVLYLAVNYFSSGGNILTALEKTIASPLFAWTPIVGWTTTGAMELTAGSMAFGLILFGVTLLATALMLVYILHSNPDYYEDVLVATETLFEKKRALAEGNVAQQTAMGKKVRVTKTGIGGAGASVFFYKHLRESFREHRLGLWGLPSILSVVVAIVLAFFTKELGLFFILMILMWMQIMFIGTGRGLLETYMPFIYMIPESPFKKILWSSGEILLKVAGETVVIFLAAGLIMSESAAMILLCMAVYLLFSFMLIGINYISMRFTGSDISAGLLVLIYFLLVMLIMVPGIVAAVVLAMLFPAFGLTLPLVALAVWELIVGVFCFYAARGILHNCDYNPVVKTAG